MKPKQDIPETGYGYGGMEPPSFMNTAKELSNTKFGKGAQLGMKTYRPMDMPELIQTEDVVDPEMMALNRMRRY